MTNAPRGERSWLDSWVNITTWWMEPAARAGADVLSYGPERILVETVDALVQRFGNGSIEFSARGRPGRANLDWLRLVTRQGRHEAYLQLSDVEFDGFAFDRLAAVVHSVELTPSRHPRLALDEIEIDGRAPLKSLLHWIDDHTGQWAISVDDAGGVTARHRTNSVTAEVELSVEDNQLRVELHSARWRRCRVALPAWIRLRRTVATLDLAPGLTVVEARRRGGSIDFDLRVKSIRQTLELAQLRDTLLREGRLSIP